MKVSFKREPKLVKLGKTLEKENTMKPVIMKCSNENEQN